MKGTSVNNTENCYITLRRKHFIERLFDDVGLNFVS